MPLRQQQTFSFEGKQFNKLALHGGGTAMFGCVKSFLEAMQINITNLNFPIITSSASSMAMLTLIMNNFASQNDSNEKVLHIYEKCIEEITNFLDHFDNRYLIMFDFIENLMYSTLPNEFLTLTFADLKTINPNLEWKVCCSKCDDFEFSVHTFGTHTPDVVVWKACLASMSIPVVFQPVQINEHYYCDGDFSDWIKEVIGNHENVLHIKPITRRNFDIKIDIPILDELVKFIIHLGLSFIYKSSLPEDNTYTTSFAGNVTEHFMSNIYINEGKKIATKFILKDCEFLKES